ncbi:MAG: carbamoyltransferase HypF [Kofleriaceae bacterium]
MIERLQITIAGIVQGVGFRPFVVTLARSLGVTGVVTNRGGDVVIEAEADTAVLAAMTGELRAGPAAARVDRIEIERIAPRGDRDFTIATSAETAGAAAIAPDVATCEACVAEVFATGRRSGYAFTSCAACGPRLTIVTAAPYDRARTTMAAFTMCAACRAEYEDVGDRRFHAQPIACPACGPKLACGDADDPIFTASWALAEGEILAIKGLGGYHLACDARRGEVVQELRRRKQRDAKPFAVMVANLAVAHVVAELDPVEAALLASPARPIVLARRRRNAAIAVEVAPDVEDIGIMLPYTPLHHLLLATLPNVPLVMTSGNVTDEPIAFRDADARRRLGGIARRFLTHDREIHMRCDDSIARVIDGAPAILRRARGYAPAPLRLPAALARPTLALGGHLKAAFALGEGDTAFVSPHMGDLDHLAAYEQFVVAIDHFERLHRITPACLVHDLHPDYATTRLAEQLARDRGIPRIGVQHHRAHFASVLADAQVGDRAIGVCFDGAGHGDDGTIWGGEVLVGDARSSRRAAHLRAVPQPGGDRAAIEPWRMAVAYLCEAGESVDLIATRIGSDTHAVAALCGGAPRTSSAGRLFDAVASLLGICDRSDYEGQAAMRLEALARGERDAGSYPIEIAGPVLDTLPVIRAVLRDVERGVSPGQIARRFHTTLVELAAAACIRIARVEAIEHVALTGGVFQNAILANELPRRLRAAGLVPHVHRRVPTNDGGLAFGQLASLAGGA